MNRLFRILKRELTTILKRKKWYSKGLPVKMSASEKRIYIKNGFYPSASLFYDFSNYSFSDYLNDRDYKKMYPLNPPAISALIDNKAYLPLLFQSHPEWLPEFSAYLRKGELIFCRGLNKVPVNLKELFKIAIQQYGKLIVKPTSDGGGRRIFTISATNFEEKVEKLLSNEVIVSSYMENESFLKEIYPHSLNTTRVVFFKTNSRKNKILMIGQRFGTSKSKEVDNVSSGGIGYTINIETGTLSKPYSFLLPTSPNLYDKHMDSKVQLRGFQIPNWSTRLKQIQKIADYLDFVDFAGLDLAFTTEGVKVVEINSHPEFIFAQLESPALLDEEFKEFMVKRGY